MNSDWERDKLSDRFYGCVNRLLKYLFDLNIPQYFNPRNNLLKDKDRDGIIYDIAMIIYFCFYPPQLRITTAWSRTFSQIFWDQPSFQLSKLIWSWGNALKAGVFPAH